MIFDTILGLRDSILMPGLLRQLAKNLQNITYRPVSVADYPWLDMEKLAFYEREFAALGFERRGDWTADSLKGASLFMRLMGHEGEGALVSLHGAKPRIGKLQPLRCAVSFALSDGWTVGGTDREADTILYQLRLPRSVILRDCDASPAALWQEALHLRTKLQNDLQLQRSGDASADSFFKMSAATNAARAELVRAVNPYTFALQRRALKRNPPPRREIYSGEWGKPRPPAKPPIASPGP